MIALEAVVSQFSKAVDLLNEVLASEVFRVSCSNAGIIKLSFKLNKGLFSGKANIVIIQLLLLYIQLLN